MTTKPESPDSGAGAGAGEQAVAWKAMHEAPRDGTVVLLVRADQSVTAGNWMDETEITSAEFHNSGEYLGQFPTGDIHEAGWISWDGGFTAADPPVAWAPMPLYTRAQDSGQGEAVALYREIDNAARHVSNATGDVETGKDAGALSFLREAAHHLRNALAMMERAGPHPPKPAQDAAGKGVEITDAMIAAACAHLGYSDKTRGSFFTAATAVRGALEAALSAKPAQVGEKYRPTTEHDAKDALREFNRVKEIAHCSTCAMWTALDHIGAVVPVREGGV